MSGMGEVIWLVQCLTCNHDSLGWILGNAREAAHGDMCLSTEEMETGRFLKLSG